MRARHRQAVGLQESGQRLVVVFSGAEAFGKLRRGQVLPEVRAGGIGKLLQKRVQFFLIAKGQSDRQAAFARPGHPAHSLGFGYRLRYMPAQNLCAGGLN